MKLGKWLRASVVFASLLCVLAAAGPARAAQEGELTQLADPSGCIVENPTPGECEDADQLLNANALAVSPDGKNVYAVGPSGSGQTLTVFTRQAGGELVQYDDPNTTVDEGCFTHFYYARGSCGDLRGTYDPSSVAVSPDGRNVYVGGFNASGIAIFERDPSTGALTQPLGAAGCVADWDSACGTLSGANNLTDVAVSPDNKTVYATGYYSQSIVALSRDDSVGGHGELTQLGGTDSCLDEDGPNGTCRGARGMGYPERIGISPGGENVYVGSGNGGVATFARATAGARVAASSRSSPTRRAASTTTARAAAPTGTTSATPATSSSPPTPTPAPTARTST